MPFCIPFPPRTFALLTLLRDQKWCSKVTPCGKKFRYIWTLHHTKKGQHCNKVRKQKSIFTFSTKHLQTLLLQYDVTKGPRTSTNKVLQLTQNAGNGAKNFAVLLSKSLPTTKWGWGRAWVGFHQQVKCQMPQVCQEEAMVKSLFDCDISSRLLHIFIICRADLASLNKRNELATSCRHARKFLLSSFTSSFGTQQFLFKFRVRVCSPSVCL